MISKKKFPKRKKSGTKWRQRNRSFFFSGKPPVELKKVCRQLNSSSSFVAKVLIGHLRPRSCCLCFSSLLSFVSLEPLSLLVFRSSLISSATTWALLVTFWSIFTQRIQRWCRNYDAKDFDISKFWHKKGARIIPPARVLLLCLWGHYKLVLVSHRSQTASHIGEISTICKLGLLIVHLIAVVVNDKFKKPCYRPSGNGNYLETRRFILECQT